MKLGIINNLSRHTDELKAVLRNLHVPDSDIELIPYDTAQIEAKRYTGLVFTGRTTKPYRDNNDVEGLRRFVESTDRANIKLIKDVQSSGTPALLLCYSTTLFARLTGGGTIKLPEPIDGVYLPVTISEQTRFTNGVRDIYAYFQAANRICRIGNSVKLVGSSQSYHYAALESKEQPIFGTAFHPENSGEEGMRLIKNFLVTAGIK